MFTKRSVVHWEGGMCIIQSTLPPSGEMVAEVTSVDLVKGKNVTVVLDGKSVHMLMNHRQELLHRRRSKAAAEASARGRKRRPREIGEV